MQLKWKHLFSNTILRRGQSYSDDCCVGDIHRDGNRYTTQVYGTRLYSVSADIWDNKIIHLSCNCPHAQEGNRCKHMAAMLYEMEYQGMISELALPKLVKLPLNMAGVYQYYDTKVAADTLDFTETMLKEAQGLIEEGKIYIEQLSEGFVHTIKGNQKVCIVKCSMKTENGRKKSVTLHIAKDALISVSCDMPDCWLHYSQVFFSMYDGRAKGCVHTAAAFLLLDRYMQSHPIGDATDYQGQNIIQKFREKRQVVQIQKTAENTNLLSMEPVKLEPRLEIERNDILKLRFKVGDQKLYTVKDFADLIACVEAKKHMQLGTKKAIHFGSQNFDETSQSYYDLIRRETKAEDLRDSVLERANRYYAKAEENKNSILLYGSRLDEFFDLAQGTDVSYVDKRNRNKETGNVRLCDGAFESKLTLHKEISKNGNFEGIHIKGENPQLFEGVKYKYLFADGKLQRLNREDMDLLETLRTNEYSNDIDFVVGRNHLSEFFYRVLPMIEQQATVDFPDREEIQQYLYPEGKFVFYLDAEDDNVTCLPKVFYGEESFIISNDITINPARDSYQEQQVLTQIQNYFPYTDLEEGVLHCDADESLIFQVLRDGVNALLALGEVQASEQFNRLTIRRKPQISVGVQMESDLLNLTVTSADLSEEELVGLLQSYRKKKKYHRLRNGDFVHVDNQNMEELSHMLDVMKISLSDFVKGNMQIPAYRALYLDKLLEKNDAFYAKRDKNFKNLIKDFKTISDSDYEAPESLQDTMRNYQEFGFKWLRTIENCKFGGILADDMGLGKTLQMISLLLSAKEEGRLESALIVTPASLVYNWQAEFEKFAPELRVATVTGTKRERESKLTAASDVDVLITSYDLLKRDIKVYEDLHFTYQVIDEAQYIKTHTTAAAKSVKVINSDVRFALTGTPIENRLSELWSIFDYLMPGFLYAYDRFRREFETPIVKNKDDSAMQRLKRMVEPFILRRLKGDVLADLPEKIEEVHYVQFEPEQQKLYDGQAVYMKQMIEGQNDEAFQKGKIQILAELTKIRQICCDPGLCFENYNGESAKRIACMELIQSAIDGEHKVLLFSQFTSLLAMMEEDLRTAGIDYYKITGETKKEDRIQMVNQFNGDATPVFLVSLKAGGTGLNLTGADIVIHFDPWWNLAAQNQATDRAHRIGQTRAVSVYKLIAKNSIEEKILALQEQKGQLADEILSGKEGGLMTMSREELLELL